MADALITDVPGVIGIGTDLVEVERFRVALQRRPTIEVRLFSEAERAYSHRYRDPTKHLAARFGAKEAVMKAMGVGLWKFPMRDVEVVTLRTGQPVLALHGKAATMAVELGVREWRLTLTHTDTMAQAIAVALG